MTEKSQSEQNAAQHQIELLAEALEKARTEGGRLLKTGKYGRVLRKVLNGIVNHGFTMIL